MEKNIYILKKVYVIFSIEYGVYDETKKLFMCTTDEELAEYYRKKDSESGWNSYEVKTTNLYVRSL